MHNTATTGTMNSKLSEPRQKTKRGGFWKRFKKADQAPQDSKVAPLASQSPSLSADSSRIRSEGPPTVPPGDSSDITPSVSDVKTPELGRAEEGVKEERLPVSVTLAKEKLNKSAEELNKKIPKAFQESTTFEVEGSGDVISLADNIGAALVELMAQRNVEKSKQGKVQTFAVEWAKKTVPFAQDGLSIAKVPLKFFRKLSTNCNRMSFLPRTT